MPFAYISGSFGEIVASMLWLENSLCAYASKRWTNSQRTNRRAFHLPGNQNFEKSFPKISFKVTQISARVRMWLRNEFESRSCFFSVIDSIRQKKKKKSRTKENFVFNFTGLANGSFFWVALS